jgi:hypothetical protein
MASKVVMTNYNYDCLVCGKGGADNHVFHATEEDKRNVWYGGISWHTECLNINSAIGEVRNRGNQDR